MFSKRISRHSEGSIGKPHPKSQFTSQEDAQLLQLVSIYGENWEVISSIMGNRNVRQCKERYGKYLSPDINRKPFSKQEDELLIEKYNELGPRWVKISNYFNKRTDASLKNRWNVLVRHYSTNSTTSSGYASNAASPSSEPDEEYHCARKLNSNFNIVNKITESPMNLNQNMQNVSVLNTESFPEFETFEDDFDVDLDFEYDAFEKSFFNGL